MKLPHLVSALGLLAYAIPSPAQDPFEIHIYQYETLEPGRFTLEQHLNYVGVGTKTGSGTVAPSNDQLHLTYEVTGAITDNLSLGFMLLTGEIPGTAGLQYAGWRVLPHFYVPREWHWPVDLGFVAEFSFQTTQFEENSRRVELRPIVEKRFGDVLVTVNPVFERALHGPGVGEGWIFSPGARVGYQKHERFAPSVEYYSSLGPVQGLLPAGEQLHQLYFGGDLKVRENLLVNAGVGVGLTSAGEKLVFKSRVEWEFGRK
jgi:hypothetical protein